MTSVRWNAHVLLAVCVVVGGLAACGGGGGGGGGGGNSAGPAGGAQGLTYSGSIAAAAISTGNASQLSADVMGGNVATAVGVLSAVAITRGSVSAGRSQGFAALARRLYQSSRSGAFVGRSSSSRMLAGAAIDRSELCDSGSVHVFGNVDDATQTGTITAVYANCRTGSDVVNGQATLDIVAYDKTFGLATDETLTFTRASFVGPGMNVDLSGSIRRQIDQTAKTYTYTENFVTVDNLSRLMTKTENLLITDTYIGLLGGAYTEAIRGRVYDSVHGYADVTTTVPLSFGTLNPEYPSSGQIVLHGVNSRTAVLTALSETLFTLAVDEDGNGIYEVNVTLKWSDLGTPVASDLADTDGDGMHNSWESANGLDPHNPADANLDADGDGYSNKLEYLGGTDPRNAASAPPATGLKVTMSDFPDPVTTGTNLLYYIEVSNIAPAPASNVVITDVLPASVTFVSAAATQGSCSGTGPVTCMLANVAGFTTVEIRLIVSPATQGLITNTVTASSSSFDPDLSDNTATVTPMVGQPAAGLQDLIDAAQPGDTIIVPPGIYTGGLNYHGKNVNLR